MIKRKLYVLLAIAVVAILPSAVFASVVIDQSVAVSSGTAVANPLYIAPGPNYNTAKGMGFTSLIQNTSTSGGTITLSYTTSLSEVYLLNVFEINGTSALDGKTVSLYLASSSTGVTLYESSGALKTTSNPSTLRSELVAATTISTSGTSITLTPPPPGPLSTGPSVLGYLTVELTGPASSGSITFDYTIS
jgi:hypothetical protein